MDLARLEGRATDEPDADDDCPYCCRALSLMVTRPGSAMAITPAAAATRRRTANPSGRVPAAPA